MVCNKFSQNPFMIENFISHEKNICIQTPNFTNHETFLTCELLCLIFTQRPMNDQKIEQNNESCYGL